MEVIRQVKEKIEDIQGGLPTKTLSDGTTSQLTIVPFYNRSGLIAETLNTLNEALFLQILITILVIVVMVYNLRASVVISSLLPLAILITFMAMKTFKVDANIVSLSGIAIAIGTMVDLGIILSENVIKKFNQHPGRPLLKQIYEGAEEVSSAILTAVTTTVISFLPVFTLQATEGKLFIPLAFTKTFALLAALLISFFVLPALMYWLFKIQLRSKRSVLAAGSVLAVLSIAGLIKGYTALSLILLLFTAVMLVKGLASFRFTHTWISGLWQHLELIVSILVVCGFLSAAWSPLGDAASGLLNYIFVLLLAGLVLGFFLALQYSYIPLLRWCLEHKKLFLSVPVFLVGWGLVIWLGFGNIFGFISKGFNKAGINIENISLWSYLDHTFPGLGNEFMPAIDEGTFLLMPTTMPHSGVEYNQEVLAQLDQLVSRIPEVERTVGKMGRAETALDPAPISMFENIIDYRDEYSFKNGKLPTFKTDDHGRFITVSGDSLTNDDALERGFTTADLTEDAKGKIFRNWRTHIRSPDDIWNEIVRVSKIPGLTSSPKLQPIETRLVMLQTGMNAPMGIKIHGPDPEIIEAFGMELEKILKTVPGVKPEAVFAQRVVGQPYINLSIDRQKLGRYGLTIDDVQATIELAIGGTELTTTVEGRERYAVRVRYPRELRDNPDEMENILITSRNGLQIPLAEVVTIEYRQGPQEIYSENTFLTSFVLFDKAAGYAETNAARNVIEVLDAKLASGEIEIPSGVTYEVAGNYENQLRAEKRFRIIIPIVLAVVFLILYLQFRSVPASLIVFSSISLAFAGGFVLLWLYGQPWFLDFSAFGKPIQELFRVHPVNLSVAVWVGFIALFGLATDDSVLMATYLDQSFKDEKPKTIEDIKNKVLFGAERRIRPAVMTAATTVIALLPVLTSSGRGADIMIPMAIPAFGGMIMTCVTFYIVPTLYSIMKERQFKKSNHEN